jgi:voltage-gated potassium channel
MMKLAEITASRVYRSFALASVAMLLVLLTGTVGYRVLGGPQYSWIDCFYMTFITVTTIGYSEIVDLSYNPLARLFNVFIALLGIGTMTYMLSTLTAFILESGINEAWRRKKMQNKIAKLKDHFIVCGMGRVGSNVAHELVMTGRQCVIVDHDLSHIENYLITHPEQLYLHGDVTDNDTLLAVGVNCARGLFAVAADDSQNLVISLSAKQLNAELRVVARCHDLKNMEKTRRAGADEIVSPDFSGGQSLVSAMLRPHVESFLDEMIKSDGNLRLEEIIIPAGCSSSLLAIFSHASRDCILLAIRQQGAWIFNPIMEKIVQEGDVLMVMITPHERIKLEKLIHDLA